MALTPVVLSSGALWEALRPQLEPLEPLEPLGPLEPLELEPPEQRKLPVHWVVFLAPLRWGALSIYFPARPRARQRRFLELRVPQRPRRSKAALAS